MSSIFYISLICLFSLIIIIFFADMRKKKHIRMHINNKLAIQNVFNAKDFSERYSDLKSKSIISNLRRLKERSGINISFNAYMLSFLFAGLCCFIFLLVYTGKTFLALILGSVIALLLPLIVLKYLCARRQRKFLANFPDAIDSVVRAIQSGLPLFDGFSLLSAEAEEPIKSEFSRIVELRKLGATVPEAVESLTHRIDAIETRLFSTVVKIQNQSGGSISESLSNISTVIRNRIRMREKVNALAAEAKASAYIIGSLPFFIIAAIYFSSPDYIILLFTTFTGNFVIYCSLAWMAIGIALMWKMINFEI
ncbi:type II secretion system F family protein [Brucella gallinifaecis]|uniref:Type II secretion system F family protein n=1 Tax=Brucella gallinifaecis TaxID=215590 RepID=A0A502BP74_9HYPH|nr:type II secretion system F family protein [Brucella gallinifaecis]TPF75451.1 type II secretion system F family protein [Brucella gallinifaecis]